MSDSLSPPAPRGTQAVIRALRLLKSFSPSQPRLSLRELAAGVGLSKTTTHRLLQALESEGMVTRDEPRGSFLLGPEVIALGSQAWLSSELCALARPALERLAALTGETTTLEVLVADQMLILDGVRGRHLISAALETGSRWPVTATATGRSVLAQLPKERRELLLARPLPAFTPHTLTQAAALRRELDSIRRQGFAVAVAQIEPDYIAIATAFLGPRGEVRGALSVGGPATRFSDRRIRSLGRQLQDEARQLTQSTELRGPAHRPTTPDP